MMITQESAADSLVAFYTVFSWQTLLFADRLQMRETPFRGFPRSSVISIPANCASPPDASARNPPRHVFFDLPMNPDGGRIP